MLVVLAGLAAAAGLAAPAHAGPGGNSPDASFLSALDRAGIAYQNPSQTIATGKVVCQWLGQGQSEATVIDTVSTNNPGFTLARAAVFTTIAATAYCPQHAGDPQPWEPPVPAALWNNWPEFPVITPGAAG